MEVRRGLIGVLVWAAAWTACGEAPAPTTSPADETIPTSLLALGYGGEAEDVRAPGVTIRTAQAGSEVLLTTDGAERCLAFDRSGQIIWSQTVPGRSRVEYFAPLPDGGVLALSTDEGITRLNPAGQVLWQTDCSAHHELCPTDGGAFLTATHTTRTYCGRRVRFDEVQRIDPNGQRSLLLDLFEIRAQMIPLTAESPLDKEASGATTAVYDRFHLNSIQVLPESDAHTADGRFAPGNLLLCLRNANLVLVVDPETSQVLWHLAGVDLDRPHGARMNGAGELSIFDNGWHRGRSRVLILNILTAEVLRIEDGGDQPFFTRTRGFAQQLGQKRLLVTLSEQGRVLEFDGAGNLAYEWNTPLHSQGARSALYRVMAAPPDFPPN